MGTVTTPCGFAQIFANRLGVGPRIPRKQLRAFRRELKTTAYRKAERRAIAAAVASENEGEPPLDPHVTGGGLLAS